MIGKPTRHYVGTRDPITSTHSPDVALTSVPLLIFNESVVEFSHRILKPFN